MKGGTIEKGLRMVLDGTGAGETEIVRLASQDIKICVACKKCAPTNRCVLKDDVNGLLDKIEESDAYVLSGYPSFSSLNALTKAFMERCWPLRHNFNLTRGKAGGAVVIGGGPVGALGAYFKAYFEGYLLMDFMGTLELRGNVPS